MTTSKAAESLKGRQRVMFAMARNAEGGEVVVLWSHEKRAVVELEKKGLVTLRRTVDTCGGMSVWWFRLTK